MIVVHQRTSFVRRIKYVDVSTCASSRSPKSLYDPASPIDPITIGPRSAGIHNILRHVRDPGERHDYFPPSLLVLMG